MQAKSVKEVLTAAHWILSHLGWAQSAYFRNKNGSRMEYVYDNGLDYQRRVPAYPDQLGSCCMGGAIELVETTSRLRYETIAFLSRRMSPDIAFWNDKPERTKEEVLTTLKQAIQKAP